MNVSLTKELDTWVNEKVDSGDYYSASEVIREGLRLLKEKELQRQTMLKDLHTELMIGVKQLDSGKSRPLNEQLIAKIKSEGRKHRGK